MNNQRVLLREDENVDGIQLWMDSLIGLEISDVEYIDSIQAFQIIKGSESWWLSAIVVVNTTIEISDGQTN